MNMIHRNSGERKRRTRRTVTFINAFESSPVHCAKSRPSGKRRNPGKGGTADILDECKNHISAT